MIVFKRHLNAIDILLEFWGKIFFKPFMLFWGVGLFFSLCLPLTVYSADDFIALAYHDVVNHRDELTFDAVTLDNLIDHFEWLKATGYHPVSIADLQAAKAGTRPLPDKAVLLCWDDGYTSFYERVLPLLKAYQYPAVLALVGSWMSPGPEEMVQYGNKQISRKKFMSWEQLKEVAESGLVEIASHSYNLHTTVLADPFGDKLPAVIAHQYDPTTDSYETEEQFRERIRLDLQKSSDLILQHLGFRPQVLVWPFGQYNMAAQEIAATIGMSITLTLDSVPGNINNLHTAGRIYPTRNPDLKTFRSYLDPKIRPEPKHFFRVNSQDLLEPSPDEEQHFSAFLDRVKYLDPNMVVVDPVVEENGTLMALFDNKRLPVAQDRLMRINWHTGKRALTEVFLWLSSPLFTPVTGESTATINAFFSDMGKSAPGAGLIVDRPGLVPALLQNAASESGQEAEPLYWNPARQRQARKSLYNAENRQLSETFQALEVFQQWQPFQEVGLVVSMDDFRDLQLIQVTTLLKFFDFLVVDSRHLTVKSLRNTINPQLKILHSEGYLRKCSFLLTAEGQGKKLASELHLLPTLNIINWGYQYDRFLENSPPAADIRPLLSKKSFPYPLHR